MSGTNSRRAPEIESAFDLLEAGRRVEAIEAFERALVQYPRSVRGWLALGQAYSDEGNSAKALASYQRALDLRKGDELCSLSVYHALKDEGRYAEARQEAERFMTMVARGAACTEETRRLYGWMIEDDGSFVAALERERQKKVSGR